MLLTDGILVDLRMGRFFEERRNLVHPVAGLPRACWKAAFAFLLVVVSGLALAACNSRPQTIRYKLTVDVTVDGTIHSGSVVNEAYIGFHDGWFNISPVPRRGFSAEAAIVELGSAGTLFVLVFGDDFLRQTAASDPAYLIFQNFPESRTMDFGPNLVASINRHQGPVDIKFEKLPMMVRFRDIADRNTVELVEPDNISKIFEYDMRFLSAKIEISKEPLTRALMDKLPWVAATKLNGIYFGGNYYRSSSNPERNLRGFEFTTEKSNEPFK